MSGYEIFLLLITASLGYLGAPWWIVLMIATLLLFSTLEVHSRLESGAVPAASLRMECAYALAIASLLFVCGRIAALFLAKGAVEYPFP